MKNLLISFIAVTIFSCFLNAQTDNYRLDFKLVVKSKDGRQKLVLFNRGNIDAATDGYILITRGYKNIEGQIQKGGFNFLDPKIFEVGIESLRRKWVENNFPLKDVTVMSNGIDVQKVYSFEIKPEVINIQSDSISFFIKGAFYDLLSPNAGLDEFNSNYNINLTYKLFKVPYNKSVSLDFLNEQFKDFTCSVTFKKIRKQDEYLSIKNNQHLFDGIKQSAGESTLPHNVRFNIGAEFMRTKADDKDHYIYFSPYNFLLRIQQHSLIPKNKLIDKPFDNSADLPVDAYYAEMTFPFRLYNKEKAELYKDYKTKKEIFRSKYNVVVVPVSLNEDTLTADVFLNYSKISLDDDIPRWTPIKKRIKLIEGNLPVALDLPKENWSANFTREGERYNIYGNSDFERYVNEYLLLSFHSVKQINGN